VLDYTRLLKPELYYDPLQFYFKLGYFPLRTKFVSYLLITQALKILTEQTPTLDRKQQKSDSTIKSSEINNTVFK
jgi:hypothetical protein